MRMRVNGCWGVGFDVVLMFVLLHYVIVVAMWSTSSVRGGIEILQFRFFRDLDSVASVVEVLFLFI